MMLKFLSKLCGFLVCLSILPTRISGQRGLCRNAPLKSVIQGNGHMQDYCEYVDGKNRMVMFPGSEFTKHCSVCKCTSTGLQCCQMSPTPDPASIPLGCIAILDGCMYRTVLVDNRNMDCYEGLASKAKNSGNKTNKNFPKLTSTKKPKMRIKQDSASLKQIKNILDKRTQPKKQARRQKPKANPLPKGKTLQKRPKQVKSKQQQEKTNTKNVDKKALTAKMQQPLESLQPFEINSILNGKDTFLVISLRNKISERANPKQNKKSNTGQQTTNNQNPKQGEQTNQGSEAQQELIHKLERSLKGEYDFTMMDYYNMFNNFQQQSGATTMSNIGGEVEGTTMPITTESNVFETNHVSVVAIKSSNTQFMKWLIDTLGNLGLIQSQNNQTKTTTKGPHKKLEMVLKNLVGGSSENSTKPTFVAEVTKNNNLSPPSYILNNQGSSGTDTTTNQAGSTNNQSGSSITDIKEFVNLLSSNNMKHKSLGSGTVTSKMTSESGNRSNGNKLSDMILAPKSKVATDLRTTLLDTLIDKLLQNAIRKKNENNNPITTPSHLDFITKVSTSDNKEGGFDTLGIQGLLGLGLIDQFR